jgi:hypothetical protein
MSYINETVSVNAFYFAGRAGRMFPRQIELGEERYTFQDGLQYLVRKGQHIVRLFDMTDGQRTYRLRCEDDTWTLIGTR